VRVTMVATPVVGLPAAVHASGDQTRLDFSFSRTVIVEMRATL
jgi:hypothetical protein